MKYLIVVAHPDDEVLGCGASIYKWTRQGDKVDVCIMSAEAKARAFRPDDKALDEIVLTTSAKEMNLDADNYKSDYISIANTANLGDYRVRIITGGSNYVVLDESGSARNTFSPNERFIIASRELQVTRVEDIVIRVESTKSVNVGFRYVNGIDQKLIAVAPGSYTAYGTLKLHVNWIKPTRDISVAKLDSETNRLVAGAILELYDSNNNLFKSESQLLSNNNGINFPLYFKAK